MGDIISMSQEQWSQINELHCYENGMGGGVGGFFICYLLEMQLSILKH